LLEGKIKQIESRITEGFGVIGKSIDSINFRLEE
jgi:hypothetical protein